MFTNQTTIILGAGASLDHGFPLGQKLMTDIIDGLGGALKAWETRVGDRSGLNYDGSDAAWLKFRYWNLCDMLNSSTAQALNFNAEIAKEFVKVASNQTATSIDRFLRDNPKFARVGRYAIALEICAKHWSEHSEGFGRTFLARRDYSVPNNLSWTRNLINRIREGASSSSQLPENRLCIVTFNYDVSLESCLHAQFDNTEVHKGANWKDSLEILHVYGNVADQSYQNFNRQKFLDDVSSSASQIDVIGQTNDTDFNERIAKIKTAIRNSSRVIIAGFSFDEANIKLLNLEYSNSGSKLLVHNFNGDNGLNRIFDRLKIPQQNRFGPSNSEELTIASADDQGLFRPDANGYTLDNF
jgi:hypothetical protein